MELPETQSLGTQYYINVEKCHNIQPAPPPFDISEERKDFLLFTQDLTERNVH